MYTPLLPGNSITSWLYLKDSRETQLAAFSNDRVLQREQANFAGKIGQMSSVDDLMKDYQALKVALGAHGLKDDLPNRYFIRQVIEQGTDDPEDFANKLSDGRYAALAKTFEALGLTGSGDLGTSLPALDDALSAAVTAARGESPVYLNAAAKLSSALTLGLLGADTADRVWQRALERPGVSETLQRVFGTSASAAGLDADGQIAVFRESAEYLYGSTRVSALIDPANAFAVADAYLGTAGQALEDGFSYSGLQSRLASIAAAQGSDADRWSALQADAGLRDVMAAALGVADGFAALDAAGQISALQTATQSLFGRSDFAAFGSQANLTALGDRYLDPQGRGFAGTFTLGAFTAEIEAARDEGPGMDQRWQAVLSVDTLREAMASAFGLEEGFSALSEADQLAALKQAMKAQFGTEDVAALEEPAAMAAFSGLYVDAQIAGITQSYMEQEFRIAVGELRPELRVAMSVAEELQKAVESGGTEVGQWYRALGNSVLREAFEGAFGLSDEFAQMDLDGQVSLMRTSSERLIGSSAVADFLAPEAQEKLITQYLARAGTSGTATSGTASSLFADASASSILATIYGS
ncbi:DUF1217 domain-containing protein [Poseidonocella sp. HB161398]|uniref:DUF1217 domain-containing protein n=1 Tax=Poseidonocella sp. HB161398 TaxID=2320855 RepID=UPI0011088340|nr:DUF1217 domain-containing protein [Poseidonocella sp. HB161398]